MTTVMAGPSARASARRSATAQGGQNSAGRAGIVALPQAEEQILAGHRSTGRRHNLIAQLGPDRGRDAGRPHPTGRYRNANGAHWFAVKPDEEPLGFGGPIAAGYPSDRCGQLDVSNARRLVGVADRGQGRLVHQDTRLGSRDCRRVYVVVRSRRTDSNTAPTAAEPTAATIVSARAAGAIP